MAIKNVKTVVYLFRSRSNHKERAHHVIATGLVPCHLTRSPSLHADDSQAQIYWRRVLTRSSYLLAFRCPEERQSTWQSSLHLSYKPCSL